MTSVRHTATTHAVCILSSHRIDCYAGEQSVRFDPLIDIQDLISRLMAQLQQWDCRRLSLLLDFPDESLSYRLTPNLYPWETNGYTSRQLAKQVMNLEVLAGYHLLPLAAQWSLPALFRPQPYLLLLFSQPKHPILSELLQQLTQQHRILLTRVDSLGQCLGRLLWDTRVSPPSVQQARLYVYPLLQSAGEQQVKQLLCYRHLLLIQRDIHFPSGETPEARQLRMEQENTLLMHFLQIQPQQSPAFMRQTRQPEVHYPSDHQALALLMQQYQRQSSARSDYVLPHMRLWRIGWRWRQGIFVTASLLLLLLLTGWGFIQWQMLQLNQDISAQLARQQDLVVVEAQMNEDMAHWSAQLTSLKATGSPEQMRQRVAWMADWHRLKMQLDPTSLLLEIATLMTRFPAISITGIIHHNGLVNGADAPVLDVQQASVRLNAQIDAQQFRHLPAEADSIQAFLSALGELPQVAEVELLLNPVLALTDKSMTVQFAQDPREQVIHPLVIQLTLRSTMSIPEEQ
jgi:hypothetical protein